MSARATLAPALVSLAALLAGCGGVKPADLFLVTRTGSIPGAPLTLLVNEEGGVSCNGIAKPRLADKQLVQARALQEELHGPASSSLFLPPRPGSVLSYEVRTEAGTVRFSDNSGGQPAVLHKLALFVLQVAQQTCHLPQ
jgi:hypothetical protein